MAIHGTGTDLVPLAEASARGVMVSNVPGGNAQSVAEYCAMAMLVAAMTVGIIGVGHIGTRLARICRHGLGMRDRRISELDPGYS